MRWLRTRLRENVFSMDTRDDAPKEGNEGAFMSLLTAIRDDGQMFISYAPTGCEDAKPKNLRKFLDSMLNDPAKSEVVRADRKSRECMAGSKKGQPGWIEEEL
jgi:hypothetical protein